MYWGITFKTEIRLIGTVCLWNISQEKKSVEIGYELLPVYQGQGIMQEALQTVISYAFNEIKAVTIEAVLHKDNARSVNLLLKHQFKREMGNEKGQTGTGNMINYSLSVINVKSPGKEG
jgi:ribosomal-protein-alanine N-acetyltransferase